MNARALSDIRRKLRILKQGEKSQNIARTCRYFGISRETFYRWKRHYEAQGETGLINNKPCPESPTIRVSLPIEKKFFI